MENKHGRASKIRFNKRHRKKHSNKTVDRLLYNPLKHKQKFTQSLRKELQKRGTTSSPGHLPKNHILKFGLMNVHGLNFETNLTIPPQKNHNPLFSLWDIKYYRTRRSLFHGMDGGDSTWARHSWRESCADFILEDSRQYWKVF